MDVQKLITKLPFEFHIPGYQYAGPGTKLKKRLKRGDPGINRLDRIAKQHDIDYDKARSLQDKWKADTKMIKAIERLPGKKNPHGESSQKNHASQETFKTVTFLMTFFQQQHVHA